jgi:hypothetical protein
MMIAALYLLIGLLLIRQWRLQKKLKRLYDHYRWTCLSLQGLGYPISSFEEFDR